MVDAPDSSDRSSLDARILDALIGGPLDTYSLARIVWPQETHAKAWNYQSNGGPPGWVLSLGKAVKRLNLNKYTNGHQVMISKKS